MRADVLFVYVILFIVFNFVLLEINKSFIHSFHVAFFSQDALKTTSRIKKYAMS